MGCLYLIPFLIISKFIPKFGEGEKVRTVIQEMNSLKMKDEVFVAMHRQQPHYAVDKQISQILLGNKDANTLITILTNPHCEPCAQMHKRVDNLLAEIGDKICIQYIFSSFYKDLDDSNKLLISAYQNKDNRDAIYHDWYEWGKNNKDDFRKKYDIKYDEAEVNDEFEKHETWIEMTKLRATPTILYNGYELSNNYKIEDLKYFTDLIVDTK